MRQAFAVGTLVGALVLACSSDKKLGDIEESAAGGGGGAVAGGSGGGGVAGGGSASNPPAPEGNASGTGGAACVEDGDCVTHFCDLERCAEPDVQGNRYGAECDESEPDPRIQLCGAYRCRDGRCRSCESSADCGADARCYIVPDRPGQSCGAASGDPSWTPVDDAGD
jgi:hypothetical protein